MFKFSAILAILILSITAAAGPELDKLRKVPASKYDVGLINLRYLADDLAGHYHGKNLDNSSFEVKDVVVIESGDYVYFTLVLQGPAKDMNQAKCSSFEHYKALFLHDRELRVLWPDVDAINYKNLSSEVLFRIRLISKENNSFAVEC